MSRKAYFTIFVVFILALAWCIPSLGQVVKGSISGTVTDPQNAVVSGAQVTAKNVETGVVFTTTSDSAGLFRLNALPAGTYDVDVTFQGFKTSEQKGVAVNSGGDHAIGKIALAVGDKTTTLEVTATAPLIETNDSQISSTFSGETLTTFAGIQENQGLDRLALFVPGVTATRSDNFSNTNGGGFSSNGLRGRNNDQELDGQNNNDNSVGGPALFVSDTNFVQQYVIITNNFGPEYGRNAGSVVNIITKSGTNAWHGNVFGTEYSNFLNALTNSLKHSNQGGTVICPASNDHCNPFTGPPRSNEEFSGGTIGGPLVKNKWFLFGGFDSDLFSGNNVFQTGSVTPTPAGLATLAGCFPTGTAAAQVALMAKFGPFGISAGNPTSVGPHNATVNGCPNVEIGGLVRTLAGPFHGFDFVNRIDGQLGTNDNLMARYIFNRGNNFDVSDNPITGYAANVTALSQAILLSETHNFSSHMVNEFRVGFDRLNVDFGGNNIGNVNEPTANGILGALTNVSIQGSTLGFGPATNFPQARIVDDFQIQDNWNYVKGKHSFKAGVNWTYQRSPNTFLPNVNGAYRYSNLSSFVAGVPNRIQIALGNPVLDFREYDTFLYGGDDWKITQNLTLNLGLTWTYYGNPAQLFTDITTKRESNPATALWLQSLPLSVRTVPQIPTIKNSFGPSIGFAYSPQWGGFFTGHGKTVFRGGYRLLYDPPFYNIFLNVSTAAPYGFLQSLTGGGLPNPPANPVGPNVRTSLGAFLLPNTFDPRTQAETTLSPNFGPDRVHTWSFGFERELTKNAVIEARYVGNRGTNLFQTVDGNPYAGLNLAGNCGAPSSPAPCHGLLQDFPGLIPNAGSITPCAASTQSGPPATVGTDIGRVNCGLGVVRQRNNGGYSRYNALQTQFRANNLFKQLTIQAGYTYSKTSDNVSEIFSTGSAGNTSAFAQNVFNTGSAEFGNSGLNFPNAFTVAFTEDIPFFKEQHGAVGHLLGGWGFSASYILESGQPFTPIQGNIFGRLSGAGVPANYFDTNYVGTFVGDSARAFIGSASAPKDQVGIFCDDARRIGLVSNASCIAAGGPNTLISFNAFNAPQSTDARGCIFGAPACPVVPVTNSQVRYIINMVTAQHVFGTPFGNSPRNSGVDARTNRLDLTLRKNWKIGERYNFETRMTAVNALNHFNFGSVDPNMETAGLGNDIATFGLGFANPPLNSSAGNNGQFRVVSISGNFRF